MFENKLQKLFFYLFNDFPENDWSKNELLKSTDLEMIKIASLLSSHIEIDYSKLSDRNKREYYYAKEKEYCDSLVTKKEK